MSEGNTCATFTFSNLILKPDWFSDPRFLGDDGHVDLSLLVCLAAAIQASEAGNFQIEYATWSLALGISHDKIKSTVNRMIARKIAAIRPSSFGPVANLTLYEEFAPCPVMQPVQKMMFGITESDKPAKKQRGATVVKQSGVREMIGIFMSQYKAKFNVDYTLVRPQDPRECKLMIEKFQTDKDGCLCDFNAARFEQYVKTYFALDIGKYSYAHALRCMRRYLGAIEKEMAQASTPTSLRTFAHAPVCKSDARVSTPRGYDPKSGVIYNGI